MYRLLRRGRFGNIARAWGSVQEVLDSGYRGAVSIRSTEVNNPVRLYHVPSEQLADQVRALPESQRKQALIFSESPNDEDRLIQGELARHLPGLLEVRGLCLRYTYSPLPMRLAFEADWKARYESKTMPVGDGGLCYGIRALGLLKANMLPADLDDILELLDDFPDHIVEFTTFRNPVGVIPGRQTLIWEVRKY